MHGLGKGHGIHGLGKDHGRVPGRQAVFGKGQYIYIYINILARAKFSFAVFRKDQRAKFSFAGFGKDHQLRVPMSNKSAYAATRNIDRLLKGS